MHRRTMLGLIVAVWLLCALPATALGEWTTLTPPASVDGTFTLSIPPVGSNLPSRCFADFAIPLHRGESVTATLTTGPGVTGTDFRVSTSAGDYFIVADSPAGSVTVLPFASETSQTVWLMASASTPGTFTLDVAPTPPFKISLGPMSAPKTVKRRRAFTVSTALADYNGFMIPIRFMLDRWSHGRWRPYSSASAYDGATAKSWSYGARLKLPRGKFRIRARFKDATHSAAIYNRWKTVVVY